MTSSSRAKWTTLLTPGVGALLVLIATGIGVAAWRFLFGLSATTNLDQQHPWGLWIAIDVSTGVALAAGGFTTAALVYVFHRESYHVLSRPALLTALLGYTFVALGLLADLGRYYNIWHPIWPTMWQGNSVLFEVGICVTIYLTVLYVEFLPVACEWLMNESRYPRIAYFCERLNSVLKRTMILFILAGVVLSCLHQSSLGNLMVIAPSKVHPLWWTPILSLLFLLSAIAVGFPMVIVESLTASWAMGHRAEMELLSRLARYIPVLLGIYAAFKIGDMLLRASYRSLGDSFGTTLAFVIEMGLGVLLPMFLLMSERVRRSRRWLLWACMLVVLGVALNRVNVFLVAFRPPYSLKAYFPSVGEILVTLGLISGLVLAYRVIVTYLPVISHAKVRSA